uniref:(California timema) hypothetical protein n=1 Tax=Timema californicum TaxID=61474 RepID=A0A7R9PEW0_TIMCA|nr:unnamed protein product [Timema californicum]
MCVNRSLDVNLRNDMERIQALRLIRRLLVLSPADFPPALTRSLVALANGGAEEKDRMLRACLGVLAEICVLNPDTFVSCGGVSALLRNIADSQMPRIVECLCGALLFLLDRPSTRRHANVRLQSLAVPYCDFHWDSDRNREDREARFLCVRLALLSVLRSWPGILHFCHPSNSSGLQAIVSVLYLKQLEVRVSTHWLEEYRVSTYWLEEYRVSTYCLEEYRVSIYWLEEYRVSIYWLEEYRVSIYWLEEYRVSIYWLEYRVSTYCLEEYRVSTYWLEEYRVSTYWLEEYRVSTYWLEEYRVSTYWLEEYRVSTYWLKEYRVSTYWLEEYRVSTYCLEEYRKAILDLLYDLLGLPQPEWTDEFSVALEAVDPSHPQDVWRLSEGFVAAEGKAVLPHLAKFRPNIVEIHLSVLLYTFLEAGLLDAIVEVIVTSDTFISVRATILLGELLQMIHVLLPPECCNITPPLPNLMVHASNAANLPAQHLALTAVAALSHLHHLLKRRPAPASLFLDQVLQAGGWLRPGVEQPVNSRGKHEKAKLYQLIMKDGDEALKDSAVLSNKDGFSWNWNIVRAVLKTRNDALCKLEDSYHRMFLKRLVHYFKPSSNRFSRVELGNKKQTQMYTLAGCELLDCLLEIDEVPT